MVGRTPGESISHVTDLLICDEVSARARIPGKYCVCWGPLQTRKDTRQVLRPLYNCLFGIQAPKLETRIQYNWNFQFVIHSVDRYAFHCVFLEKVAASRVKGRDFRPHFSWILLSPLCCVCIPLSNLKLIGHNFDNFVYSISIRTARLYEGNEAYTAHRKNLFVLDPSISIGGTQVLTLHGDSCSIPICYIPNFRFPGSNGSTPRPRICYFRVLTRLKGSPKRQYGGIKHLDGHSSFKRRFSLAWV